MAFRALLKRGVPLVASIAAATTATVGIVRCHGSHSHDVSDAQRLALLERRLEMLEKDTMSRYGVQASRHSNAFSCEAFTGIYELPAVFPLLHVMSRLPPAKATLSSAGRRGSLQQCLTNVGSSRRHRGTISSSRHLVFAYFRLFSSIFVCFTLTFLHFSISRGFTPFRRHLNAA